MEDNNLEFPFVFPKESKPVISIIGIGGGSKQNSEQNTDL